MKNTIFLITLLYGSCAFAALQLNPDENTLWLEDGGALEVGLGASKEHWSTQNMDIASAPAGGLLLRPQTKPRRTAAARVLPVDADYPYLVMDVRSVSPQGAAYRSLSTPSRFLAGYRRMHMGVDVSTGLWILRYLEPGFKPRPYENMRWDLSGADVVVASVKAVRDPGYVIELTAPDSEKSYIEPGDKIVFSVKMGEPVEDVTLSLFCSYRMRKISVNGVQRLQLKPVDEEYNHWQTELVMERLAGYETNPGPTLKPGRMVIKATILGGSIRVPVWSCNGIEVRPKKPEEEK